ncbi:MAG: response regulator transcription factor [Arenicellales bacterium]
MVKGKSRVYIIDDDSSVRTGLARLLHSAGFETEVFASATDFLNRDAFTGLACLILDVRMPELTGTELQEKLNEMGSTLPIIFLSAHGDLPIGVEAMKQGAEDFLQKPVDESVLLTAVGKALSRHSSIRKSKTKTVESQSIFKALTPRELEILRYIIGGATNSQIAEFFNISEKTVKAHRGKIMQKSGASSAAELGWLCSVANISAKKRQ